MNRKVRLYRRFKQAVRSFYWNQFVKRVNRLAYLHYVVDEFHGYDTDAEIEEIIYIESDEWRRRGLKVHVIIQDVELPKGEKHFENADPEYGQAPLPTWDALRLFKKLVEDAEYERDKRKREGREIWVKYFTAVAAALAALASWANLYFTTLKK